MSGLTHLAAPDGLAPGNGCSHAVLDTGTFAAVSGQCAFDQAGRIVGEGGPAAQARRVSENPRRCAASVEAAFGDVVQPAHYVPDVAHLPAVRAALQAVVGAARPPERSAVQVAELLRPELLVGTEAFAVVPADAA